MADIIDFHTKQKIKHEDYEIDLVDINFVPEDKAIIIISHADDVDEDDSIYAVEDYAVILSTDNGLAFEWNIGNNTKKDLKKLLKEAIKVV